jgi:hypothetical protein
LTERTEEVIKMKAKITQEGYVLLYRKNSYKTQYCPYHPENRCADYCPLLQEHAPDKVGYHRLILCNNQSIQIVEDNRK